MQLNQGWIVNIILIIGTFCQTRARSDALHRVCMCLCHLGGGGGGLLLDGYLQRNIRSDQIGYQHKLGVWGPTKAHVLCLDGSSGKDVQLSFNHISEISHPKNFIHITQVFSVAFRFCIAQKALCNFRVIILLKSILK